MAVTKEATEKTEEAKAEQAEDNATYRVTVQCALANLRQRPNLKAKVVRQAQRGDELTAVEDRDEWTELEGGLYIMTRLVEPC